VTFSASFHVFAMIDISIRLLTGSITAIILYLVLYVPFFLLAISSLFMAWSTDPGAVPMGARPLYHPSYDEQQISSASKSSVSDPALLEAGGVGETNDDNNADMDQLLKRRSDSESSASASLSSQRGVRRCRKCNDNYKPHRAHHDSVTGRCVVKLDHFCPWVGNAVGALNHKFFVLFIGYTCLATIMSLVLITTRVFTCGYHLQDGKLESDTAKNAPGCAGILSVDVLVLFIISVLFFFFTVCMLVDQIQSIGDNTSKIARLKMSSGQGTSDELGRVTHDFNEMFGGTSTKVAWHWFLPVRVKFPNGMEEVVLGYKWDSACDGGGEPWTAAVAPVVASGGGLKPMAMEGNNPSPVPLLRRNPSGKVQYSPLQSRE